MPTGSTGSSGATPTNSTTEIGSSSGAVEASSGAPTTSVGEGTSSSSSGGPPPELVELEGPIHFCGDCFNPMSYLRACDFEDEWLCLVGGNEALWRCNGAYAHVRGYLVPNPTAGALDGACGEQLLEVTEVLEARACDPTDCGPGCSEGFDCHSTCWGDETCDEGETCRPWGLPQDPYSARHCAAPGPVASGEPCSLEPNSPWLDDCEAGAVCFDGTCRALCEAEQDYACGQGHCYAENSLAVCLPGCNPLAADCADDEQCTHVGASFTCLDRASAAFFGPSDCAGTTCGPMELCVDADSLPGCSDDACCTSLCNSATPDCAVGLSCEDLWSDDQYPELADVGACMLPGG